MTVCELYEKLSERYPTSLSCEWDNDGIMLSADTEKTVSRVLVALDATSAALEYAAKNGFDTVITHHPLIFRGIKSMTDRTAGGRRLVRAISNGISVLSFHTRLDAACGGVNDSLCKALGYTAEEKFGDSDCPELCRIFTVEPTTARSFASLVKERLGTPCVRINGDPEKTVRRVAVCGGDGKGLVMAALSAGADLFLTGDAGYNMAADAAEEGLVTLEAGHWHTEACVCVALSDAVREISGAECEIFDSCTYTAV